MTIKTFTPHTGELLKEYQTLSKEELNEVLNNTHEAYKAWSTTSFAERAKKLTRTASILEDEKKACAELMALEMGKPISQGITEIDKCISLCHYYAEHAEKHLATREIETENSKSYVCHRPLGTVFAIMPWNYPFWQVLRFLCPTLMAGNAGLLKHAPICTGTALKIESIIEQAGFPKHLFRSLVMDEKLSEEVIAHKSVIAVTLTGSERAGSAVGQLAGKHLKKIVLELGGSDPYVICDDANLELACDQIVRSRMNNSGQVCIAAKRVIVTQKNYQQLSDLILEKLKAIKMGNPLESACQFGPMARLDLRNELHKQVEQSVADGAKLILGGEIPKEKGFYYPPTMLVDVEPGMEAFEHELFGPVMCLIKANDEEHALKLANQTPYGLGAAVFTEDLEKGEHIACNVLQAGACFVNKFVGSDPRLPFGGIKLSGYGRELSKEGLLEFVNTKTIVVK